MFALKLGTPVLPLVAYSLLIIQLPWTTAGSIRNESQPTSVTPLSTTQVTHQSSSNRTKNTTSQDRNHTVCRASIKKEDSIKFLELTKHSLVNIIDVHFVYHTNYTKYTKSIIWVNSVGREILLLLDMIRPHFSSTLTVGRRSITIHTLKRPKLCVFYDKRKLKYTDNRRLMRFYGGIIQPNEELCYTFILNEFRSRWCCKTVRTGMKTNKQQCDLSIGPPLGVPFTFESLLLVFFLLSLLTMNAIHLYYLYLERFPCHKDYYKLTDNLMSSFNIVKKIVCIEDITMKSFLVRFLLTTTVLTILFALQPQLLWVLSLLWLPMCTHSELAKKVEATKRLFNSVLKKYEQFFDINISDKDKFERAVFLLTLLFNPKLWKKIYKKRSINITPCNGNFRAFIVSIIFLFFHIVFFIVSTTIIMFINVLNNAVIFTASFSIMLYPFVVIHAHDAIYYTILCIHTLINIIVFGWLWFLVPIFILPLVSGIILNSVYFLPYVTLVAVVGFYTWRSWKSLQEEFYSLKWMIYEVLQGRQSSTINSSHNEDDKRILHVVSKGLYRKIREKLLPYQTIFLVFVVKCALIVVFAFGVFELVKILQAADASPTIMVIASMTTGALPHILNIVMATVSGNEKKAHDETLRTDVERLVNYELTKDNSEESISYLRTTITVPRIKPNGDIESQPVNGNDVDNQESLLQPRSN